MILKGSVCVPNIPDTIGDVLTEQEIREASLFFQRYGGIIDVQHTMQPVGKLLESYILESPTTFNNIEYPKGSWFVSVEVDDEEIQKALNDGEYTGFSIFAAPYRSVDEMRRPMKPLHKNLTFNNTDSWKPVCISIVDIPSHPMALFEIYDSDDVFIRKWNNTINKSEIMTDETKNENKVTVSEGFFSRILGINKSEDMPMKPPEKTEKEDKPDFAGKLVEIEEKIDNILEIMSKNDNDDEKTVVGPEGIKKSEQETAENQEEGNAVETTTEPTGISKSLDPDLTPTKQPELSLLERIGRKSNGLKK